MDPVGAVWMGAVARRRSSRPPAGARGNTGGGTIRRRSGEPFHSKRMTSAPRAARYRDPPALASCHVPSRTRTPSSGKPPAADVVAADAGSGIRGRIRISELTSSECSPTAGGRDPTAQSACWLYHLPTWYRRLRASSGWCTSA